MTCSVFRIIDSKKERRRKLEKYFFCFMEVYLPLIEIIARHIVPWFLQDTFAASTPKGILVDWLGN